MHMNFQTADGSRSAAFSLTTPEQLTAFHEKAKAWLTACTDGTLEHDIATAMVNLSRPPAA